MSENKSFLRNIIGEYMSKLGKKNDKVVVVNADLSGTCRNQNFGTGLACEGFIPYVFSMAPFLTMRACEQCRTDVAYGNQNVRMIGVYAGVSGGISGATHWAIEDCGIMTSIPNIAVFEVSDANQAKNLLDYSLKYNGPMYIRSSVEPTENIYDEDVDVCAGGSTLVMDGDDGAFLCSGVIVQHAVAAAKRIREETGKKIRVVDMYSIKPIDKNAIYEATITGNVIVAQDHNIYGGLGSMVSLVIAENNLSTRFKVCGVPDKFVAMAHAGYLYRQFGIDAEGLKMEMIKMLKGE